MNIWNNNKKELKELSTRNIGQCNSKFPFSSRQRKNTESTMKRVA